MKRQPVWLKCVACVGTVACVLIGAARDTIPQDNRSGAPTANDAELSAEEWDQRFLENARRYEVTVEGQDTPLELRQEPLLKWGNPVRYQERGSMFAWLREGRPEVIGTMFTYQRPDGSAHMKHEFHSLSESSLRARFNGTTAWTPRGPALEWFEGGGSDPSRNAARRLTTMRSIARRFDLTLTNPDGDATSLRLVPQPILRYQSGAADVIDGAIFSYAVATDPEALLIVEAIDTPDGSGWRYAFARFHFWRLVAVEDEREVWSVEPDLSLNPARIGQADLLEKPYVTYHP